MSEEILNLNMDETANKFIIMARIAVKLRNKGLYVNLSIFDEYCSFCIQSSNAECILDMLNSHEITESELLSWLEIID